MTIAHGLTSQHGLEGPAAGVLPGAAELVEQDGTIPFEIRAERLARQVQSFERAGYTLETQSAMQAIVVKTADRRPLRTAMLIVATAGLFLIPLLSGAGRSRHRVVITVDRSGAVRFA